MSLPLREIRRRHEAGEKLTKNQQRKVDAQLKRLCGLSDCFEPLAWRNSTVQFCTPGHRAKAAYRVKAANRKKGRDYRERHGIVRKTVANRNGKPGKLALDKGTAKVWEGTPLLYENYKEPLRAIEKNKGFGYYGTIATTDDKNYIQCHICGHLFQSLGGHLRMHKITSEKYKEIYQLRASAALIGESVRETMQKNVVSKNIIKGKGLPPWLQEYNKKVQTGKVKHIGTKRKEGGLSLQRRNELGICPDQVLEKIRELADKLGRAPSMLEFKAHYNGRFLHSIATQHGSYLEAVKKLGIKSAKELKEPTDEEILDTLRDFKERHGRIPMTSDFKRGLLPFSRTLIFYRFGTLNNARIQAGLNAVIPLPFGQVVEMTPDQYIEYKTKGTTKKAMGVK